MCQHCGKELPTRTPQQIEDNFYPTVCSECWETVPVKLL